jgi:Holliday junction resolvasome RuvABC endonuclease subunit
MVKLSLINPVPSLVCSIDASTNNIAFAIFQDNKLIEFGKLNFKGKSTYEKVADSSKKIRAFFEQYMGIDAIVIEHTVFINSPKTAADLALVQGSILGAMSATGIKTIKTINPIAWQTFIGNNRLTTPEKQVIRFDNPGKSDSWYKNKEREFRKERTIKFVNTYYDVNVADNDIADAIGVGHYAMHNWQKLA